MHVDVPVYPGMHRHEEEDELPASDTEKSVQGTQLLAFDDARGAENVLFGHKMHGDGPASSL